MEYFYATERRTFQYNCEELYRSCSFYSLYLSLIPSNISIIRMRVKFFIVTLHFQIFPISKILTYENQREGKGKSFPPKLSPSSKFFTLINSRFYGYRAPRSRKFAFQAEIMHSLSLENPVFVVRAFDRPAHLKVKCPCGNMGLSCPCVPPRSRARTRIHVAHPPRFVLLAFPAFPSIRLDMQIISWKKSSDRCGGHGRYN